MKKIILGIVAGVMLSVGMLAGGVMLGQNVMADTLNLCDDPNMPDDLKEAAGCREGDDQKETIFGPVEIMIQVALGIIGILGVGVIIYGGAMYTTSTGDAAKVAKAKNIILYGVVGLVVALLAYAIVEFVSKSLAG